MEEWHKVGIELPPGWKDAVSKKAQELSCPMRYLWIAAIDGLLQLPKEELERLTTMYELAGRKHPEVLTKNKPGECREHVRKVIAKFASTLK